MYTNLVLMHQGMTDRGLGSHVSDCSRLQLPVRGHSSSAGTVSNVPYPASASSTPCAQNRTGTYNTILTT